MTRSSAELPAEKEGEILDPPGGIQESGAAMPRKSSTGSNIPKPEIAPKPVGLVLSSKVGGGLSASAPIAHSLKMPLNALKISSYSTGRKDEGAGGSTVTKTSNDKSTSSSSSVLKSTLKRMTKLSIHPSKDKAKEETSTASRKQSPQRPGAVSQQQPPLPAERLSRQNSQTAVITSRSQSLRRIRNKEVREENTNTMTRSGTGATLERRFGGGVTRSHSVSARAARLRDRDMFVRKSRGVQTQLSKDPHEDAYSGEDGIPTTVDFTLYMPDILGTDVDPVETHVTEHTEPPDVRKNRQLTLDNMRLQRESERLRSQVKECDSLRQELKSVRAKLDEEHHSRACVQRQLDLHSNKVLAIVQAISGVDCKSEDYDAIRLLDKCLDDYKAKMASQQQDLDESFNAVAALQQSLDRTLEQQKLLLSRYQEAESESQELQEFLQAEKMTLTETLRDYEAEISSLHARLAQRDADVVAAEERCSHLVRLGEQRHQEILALQAQLLGTQDRAKDMLLAQGAEISRANIHISELHSRLERALGPNVDLSSLSSLKIESQEDESSKDEKTSSTDTAGVGGESPAAVGEGSELLCVEPFSRSNSQFLIATATPSSSLTSEQMANSSYEFPTSESLQNLSKAITHRQESENGQQLEPNTSLPSSESLPSLVDRINEVQALLEKFMKLKNNRSVVATESPITAHDI